MNKMINPFTDMGFKRLFGREESKPVMIALLNTVLSNESKIVDITYGNKEQIPAESDGRTVIYDIYCTTNDNRHIIVEMQVGRVASFRERTVFYAARAINNQGKPSNWNYRFDEVVVIAFLKYTDVVISDRLRTEVMLKDVDTNEVFTNCLRLIYLQLPIAESMTEADCETDLDCWIYNLNNMENLDELAFKDRIPIFEELERKAQTQGLSLDEWAAYDRALKRMWDYNAVMQTERQYARTEGHAEGHAEGLAEGRAEGRAEGLAEGKAEEKKSMAKNLKSLGVDIDTIVQASGLSKEEIEKL